MGRHQESQRATVTTIFGGLTTGFIALFGALTTNKGGHPGWGGFLIGIVICLLSALGFALTLKLFERAQLHLELADAYRNMMEALFRSDAETLLPREGQKEIEEIREEDRMQYIKENNEKPGFDRKIAKKVFWKKVHVTMDRYDPKDPRGLVVPVHNANRIYRHHIAHWDLFTIWGILYGSLVLLGLVLTGWAIHDITQEFGANFVSAYGLVVFLTIFFASARYRRLPKDEEDARKHETRET